LMEAEESQRILIAELHHRTRNLLAVIQAIANKTIDTSDTLAAFRRHFNDRLAALSRVQSLISMSRPEALTIGALVRMELDALNAPSDGVRVVIEGADVLMPEAMVRTLALTLHKLATNAAKHGALATENGELHVTWSEVVNEEGRRMDLQWVETGVPAPPQRSDKPRGFGRTLIERALPFQLRAKTQYIHGPDGVRCSISIPLPPSGQRVAP
jgi:two-component sensor histidine kinase